MEKENMVRILYIEDDPEMIELVSVMLSKKNFEIIGANGGYEGIQMVEKEKPDLILLDLMMPDLDGWDVFHKIKANETSAKIPVIIITAKAQAIDRVLGLHIAKVDDYICKPFGQKELIDSIEKVIRLKSEQCWIKLMTKHNSKHITMHSSNSSTSYKP